MQIKLDDTCKIPQSLVHTKILKDLSLMPTSNTLNLNKNIPGLKSSLIQLNISLQFLPILFPLRAKVTEIYVNTFFPFLYHH